MLARNRVDQIDFTILFEDRKISKLIDSLIDMSSPRGCDPKLCPFPFCFWPKHFYRDRFLSLRPVTVHVDFREEYSFRSMACLRPEYVQRVVAN